MKDYHIYLIYIFILSEIKRINKTKIRTCIRNKLNITLKLIQHEIAPILKIFLQGRQV